jgi:hypothetical protein
MTARAKKALIAANIIQAIPPMLGPGTGHRDSTPGSKIEDQDAYFADIPAKVE